MNSTRHTGRRSKHDDTEYDRSSQPARDLPRKFRSGRESSRWRRIRVNPVEPMSCFLVPARQVASASVLRRSADQRNREMVLPTLRVDRAIRRYARLARSSIPRSITRTYRRHPSRWAEDRIGRNELLIARWRSGTARRGTNRGFVPQEPASGDGLKRLRRHDRPSEDMPSPSMGQWANDEVGADPADCADAIRPRRARRRIGGEHDARAHGGVPCRRWPDRDPRVRQLLATFPSTTRWPKSQDRNAGITSGEICSLLQAGKVSAGTSESRG